MNNHPSEKIVATVISEDQFGLSSWDFCFPVKLLRLNPADPGGHTIGENSIHSIPARILRKAGSGGRGAEAGSLAQPTEGPCLYCRYDVGL